MIAERLNAPISTAELERRWAAVRAGMAAHGIDVLLMQNNNDSMGGYVKYFSDTPATNGYPTSVVFPRNDEMTIIAHGPFATDRAIAPSSNTVLRGTKRFLAEPYFASTPYSVAYEVALAEKALQGFAGATIGLVGTATLPYSLVDGLKRGRLSNAAFTDATDMVDAIKSVKSPEEVTLIRATACMQDGAIAAAFAAVKPGMREIEVASVAQHYCVARGSEQGIYLTCSYQPGEPVRQANRYYQNRVLREGDVFTLLVETNGPGGFYTEIGRTCVLGRASSEIHDEHASIIEARNYTLKRLVPGASCAEVFAAYNDYMRRHGKAAEARVHCHGQGYDMVERPLVRHDEPMRVAANMNMACHPNYVTDLVFATLCDNYLVGERGVERLHAYPEELVEV
jgi:Xaa-Pro aminopeptidase